MIASTEHKFVLLCNPKTGTTSLEAAYLQYSDFYLKGSKKHILYRDLKCLFGNYFEDQGCEFYCVVRDPIQVMVSWYKYRSRPEMLDDVEIQRTYGKSVDRYTGDLSFEEFAERENVEIRHYMKILLDAHERIAPIKFWRFEDLSRFNDHLSDHVGEAVPLLKENKSPSRKVEIDRGWVETLPIIQRSYQIYERLKFE